MEAPSGVLFGMLVMSKVNWAVRDEAARSPNPIRGAIQRMGQRWQAVPFRVWVGFELSNLST